MDTEPKRSLRQIVEADGVRTVADTLQISDDYVRKLMRGDRSVSAEVLMQCERAYGDAFDAKATLRDMRGGQSASDVPDAA